ncbi:hypothetical protein [Singulisphaera acidiphila]|uniref:Uncharacterized protein n=1 Tax=Singulisphaera acidiphila (strain ATCC BAA-1392 / DSM 18658 / VKM B-2454 / MOB10) TaxID=886293 RepID=L0DJ35_SINAD|nr:hypothetical protein [Singulisphaera acidiphila]AGA28833.1 hypothetical protein Sinac_4656 [Singulisphaera acidiphila DSM 18658]
MGGLRGSTILLTISLGQALALGAPPEPAASPVPQKTQEKPQEKPSALEFVKAGAHLYNKGQVDKASSYFKAADRYRDQLSESEEIVLEVYLEEVESYYKKRTATAAAVTPRVDAAVAPASTTAAAPSRLEAARTAEPLTIAPLSNEAAMPSLQELRQPSRFDTTEPKQKARWLLQESREQMAKGHYTEAARKIAEAKAMNVKWGFLEESPDKAAKLLQKVMAKSPNGPSTPSARPLGVRAPDSNLPQPAGTPPTGLPNRKL